MAIEKLEFKACTKCGVRYPATTEYFYKKKDSADRLHPWCKPCKKKVMQRHQRSNYLKKNDKTAAIKLGQIESVRGKYKDKKYIKIKNPSTDKWEKAEVIGIHDHFMTVRTKNYTTSIRWVDMLTGDTKVREW